MKRRRGKAVALVLFAVLCASVAGAYLLGLGLGGASPFDTSSFGLLPPGFVSEDSYSPDATSGSESERAGASGFASGQDDVASATSGSESGRTGTPGATSGSESEQADALDVTSGSESERVGTSDATHSDEGEARGTSISGANERSDNNDSNQRATDAFDWSEAAAPNYYKVVGAARFEHELVPGEVVYEPLDTLGRAQGTAACVDYELMEAGRSRERGSMSDLDPSGWGDNEEVAIELPNGKTYHGYFWNRSHLLAKSLGGEERIENLVCGTRMQNVGANMGGIEGGMAYAETLARDWLEEHPKGNVQYQARPVYRAGEPVCRAVLVDVRSSDGILDYEVVVYNAAKGYRIDYTAGTFEPV